MLCDRTVRDAPIISVIIECDRTVKKRRDAYIKKLNGIYFNNLQKDKVEFLADHASFTSPTEVTVGERKLTAKHILIATGTKPIIPANTPGTINYTNVLRKMVSEV